jgi:hypothetical protein
MDLHQLRCFVAAAEELHFGRAAHQLDMMPSALGRYIRLLEDDLGTRLMTRTTRSVTLTDDGAVLLKETASRPDFTPAAGSRGPPSASAPSTAPPPGFSRCCFTIFASAGLMSR